MNTLKKKITFSNIVSSISIDGGILEIKQHRYFALSVLTFLFVMCGYLLFYQTLPPIVQIGIGFSLLFLVWGSYDVLTTQVSFQYRISEKYLSIQAQRKRFKLRYQGWAEGRLSLEVIEGMSNDAGEDTFQVVLFYKDQNCSIPFVLTDGIPSTEKAGEKRQEWAEKLFVGL